jgi:hypothetical protein
MIQITEVTYQQKKVLTNSIISIFMFCNNKSTNTNAGAIHLGKDPPVAA